jgi:hypothetical protein
MRRVCSKCSAQPIPSTACASYDPPRLRPNGFIHWRPHAVSECSLQTASAIAVVYTKIYKLLLVPLTTVTSPLQLREHLGGHKLHLNDYDYQVHSLNLDTHAQKPQTRGCCLGQRPASPICYSNKLNLRCR